MQTFNVNQYAQLAQDAASQGPTENLTQLDGRNVSMVSTSGLSFSFEKKKDDIDAQLAEFQLENLKKGIRVANVRGRGPVQ